MALKGLALRRLQGAREGSPDALEPRDVIDFRFSSACSFFSVIDLTALGVSSDYLEHSQSF